jgi:hypothetical protein
MMSIAKVGVGNADYYESRIGRSPEGYYTGRGDSPRRLLRAARRAARGRRRGAPRSAEAAAGRTAPTRWHGTPAATGRHLKRACRRLRPHAVVPKGCEHPRAGRPGGTAGGCQRHRQRGCRGDGGRNGAQRRVVAPGKRRCNQVLHRRTRRHPLRPPGLSCSRSQPPHAFHRGQHAVRGRQVAHVGRATALLNGEGTRNAVPSDAARRVRPGTWVGIRRPHPRWPGHTARVPRRTPGTLLQASVSGSAREPAAPRRLHRRNGA